MIDIVNYKRCVAWLRRSMAEQQANPQERLLEVALAHAYQVAYNVTESTLREALVELTGDRSVGFLSSPELMRSAVDEGLSVSSSEAWLNYGLAIQKCNATLGDSFPTDILPLLPHFAAELKTFAERLKGRLSLAA